MEVKEVWRPYPPAPRYEISNLGRVRTKADGARMTNLLKSLKLKSKEGYYYKNSAADSMGYLRMTIRIKGKQRTLRLHKMVMETFHGFRKGVDIDHIDGDKMNNRLENLRYVSHYENMWNAVEHGKLPCIPCLLTLAETSFSIFFPSARKLKLHLKQIKLPVSLYEVDTRLKKGEEIERNGVIIRKASSDETKKYIKNYLHSRTLL